MLVRLIRFLPQHHGESSARPHVSGLALHRTTRSLRVPGFLWSQNPSMKFFCLRVFCHGSGPYGSNVQGRDPKQVPKLSSMQPTSNRGRSLAEPALLSSHLPPEAEVMEVDATQPVEDLGKLRVRGQAPMLSPSLWTPCPHTKRTD